MIKKYSHNEEVHNLSDPIEIVPRIIELLAPKSVVDIGCGIGTFLYCFKQAGIADILGVDGGWVNKKLLHQYIDEHEFIERDLEEQLHLTKKYDLVVSLEVAEHISEGSADTFIQNLISSGEVILFSAAIPYQGGQNHINEQWLTYWEKLFNKHHYKIQDIIRPMFWNNPKISPYYRQNMVLVTPAGYKLNSNLISNSMKNIVHKDIFEKKARQLENIINGELSIRSYFKFLMKSVIRKIKSSVPE